MTAQLGPTQNTSLLYQYGNSGRQRVNLLHLCCVSWMTNFVLSTCGVFRGLCSLLNLCEFIFDCV